MKLINQNDYEDVIYVTKTSKQEPLKSDGLKTTIKSSGCGICCGMMVAEFFNETLSMDEAINLSYTYKANTSFGTKYKEYANALCDKFNLVCKRTDKKEELFKCLDNNGCAVVNVGGDHDGHIGLFSHTGHYIFIYKHVLDDIYILDPGIEPNKYNEESRINKVKLIDNFVVSDVNNLLEDIQNRETPIFLFNKVSSNNVFNKIDELFDEHVNIWKEVVEIDSPSDYKHGVDKVGDYFIDKAAKQLWDIEKLENDVAGDAICITMNPNAKKKAIAISGHMDTVHPINSLKTVIKDDKIYGPGVSDCKGGLVVCLLTMSALKEAGYKDRPIKFILQSDEEVGSKLSNHKTIDFMCDKAKDCLCFINTEMKSLDTAVTTRKGILRYDMEVVGKAAHSSIADQGISSILEMSHKVIELEKIKEKDGITINVGTITGGTVSNTVPEKCKISIDVRFSNEQEMNKADEYVSKISNTTYIEGTKTTLTKVGKRIAMEDKDFNRKLLEDVNFALLKANLNKLTARKANGGSDAAYTTDFGIPTLDSLGVTGGYIHSKDEYANIASLKESSKILSTIITGLEEELSEEELACVSGGTVSEDEAKAVDKLINKIDQKHNEWSK